MCESLFCSSLDYWKRKDQIQHRWMKRVYLMNKEWISAAWHIKSDGKGSKCECFLVVGAKSFATVITWRSLWRFTEASLMIPDAGQTNQPSLLHSTVLEAAAGHMSQLGALLEEAGGEAAERCSSRALPSCLPVLQQKGGRRPGAGSLQQAPVSGMQPPGSVRQYRCDAQCSVIPRDRREITAAGSDTGLPLLG